MVDTAVVELSAPLVVGAAVDPLVLLVLAAAVLLPLLSSAGVGPQAANTRVQVSAVMGMICGVMAML
ncbi:hypothetical protein [Nannocystis sp.]|uniref:hypothetical protein n=1 Tax=Nannocystis sp. TaxID=1962667 RepID=UPI0025FE7923|nr:hypothetical protein [Nannocystis sp.]